MHGMRTPRVAALALVGTIIATGCGRAAARVSDVAIQPQPAGDSCWLVPPPDERSDSLLLVIHGLGRESPGAAQFDEGRRLVARLTAEDRTPTDCVGEPIAGGTIRWTRDSSARGERLLAIGAHPALRIATLDASADARDALDRGADLLVTADPAAVAYARALGDRLIVPLEMRWRYGVLTAGATDTASLTTSGLAQLRASLSRDVVPAAARTVADSSVVRCIGVSGVALAARSRIVHRADDPVARAIAGRLVSLAVAGDATVRALVPHDGAPLVAAPLEAGAFAAALAGGEDAAYVMAWQKSLGDPCPVPQPSGAAHNDAPSGRGAVVTPLIDAGQWAIVRRGALGLVMDSRGELRLVPANDSPRGGAP
jgi:hypothetical protein